MLNVLVRSVERGDDGVREALVGVLARCEVPDLSVLPARWPQLATCDFRAGLELRRMHFGLWLASWAVRCGLLRNLPRRASALLALSNRWLGAGSDVRELGFALIAAELVW